ncbi:MAG: DNA polymerase III subunit alpha, partial [Lachnospiraceae bacterium]|nr:DNA polymerase III subunit alpha [Lachnospiraceae bacterium]
NYKLGKNLTKEKHISHEELIEIIEDASIKRKGFEDFILVNNTLYRIKKIKSIEKIDINEKVYCLNTPSHNFVLNNVVVHNCLGSYPAFLARESRFEELENWFLEMQELFGKGNFYLEMQPPAKENNEQDLYNHILVSLSSKLDIPYIVTTDSHYLEKEDAKIHKAYLNSQDGEREVDEFYATTYMMNTEELESYFAHTDINLQKAYQNIQTIADSCEDYDLQKPLKIPRLLWKEFHPKSSPKEWYDRIPQLQNFFESDYEGDKLLSLAIVERLEKEPELQEQRTYDAIDECLDMTWESSNVNKTHWSAYYLNLQKIIDTCWNAGSIVGPGRGSGVGFILLYLLDITQINPLRETTPTFAWRFLNPSRVSVLDVDFDIEGGRRTEVLNKFREVYGQDRVSNVATFGTEKSKAAIQTAARGLGIDVDEAQYISSFIPSDRGMTRTLAQCYYGDKNNDMAPVKPFVNLMDANPELWRVAQKIEGLVCRMGIHAGGVIFVDEPFTESASLMTAPDGTVVTSYELHDSEATSLIKYDVLSVEALDKIHNCLNLLIKHGYVEDTGNLRETYENVIGIYKLERTDPKMWEMVHKHEILSLFQMEKQSGIQGIALSKPQNVDDLATLNSVIRLMAPEKNAEQPLTKFARFRNDIHEWYREMEQYGLTKKEQRLLEPILLPSSGMCESQEGFMQLVQIPECGGFDLAWADRLRKSIAKKQPKDYNQLTKEYFERVEERHLSKNLCNYVWNVLVATSRGYGFNKSHTLAYSLVALQEMNLAYRFPIIYWNTACLIVDSGGFEGTTDYTKMAQSVNHIRQAGINVSLVDINHSSFGFEPDEKNNRIMFGLKALTSVGDEVTQSIIDHRPYLSLKDFMNKVPVNKQAMIALIKGGAFDQFYPREEIMIQYLWFTCDKKKRLTLQNLPGLIRHNLIPDEDKFKDARRYYEFTRYLKNECKVVGGDNYKLTDRAIDFLCGQGYEDLMEDSYMNIKKWDKVYQQKMDIFREWIKSDTENILEQLNNLIFMQDWNKYAYGNISSWEMEALCFYYHDHELKNVNNSKYGFVDFFKLPEEPTVEKVFKKGSSTIPIYKLHKICGTCIAKNKTKSIVYLLTTTGVVPVKFRQEYFSLFDRQTFKKGPDGRKTIIERSWFGRGKMIIVQGIRRGDEFVSKKYASSNSHQLYKIDEVNADGTLVLRSERKQGEYEEESEEI